MLDILSSPLRGYIAQNLQFYLSKYIEGIQLEGLGLFGGDLVLNDLEIKRHVLVESLEIPSSFDFSRGFIRELRIHIPWTQLLSQPIEVKLYTIELILTARDDSKDPVRRPSRSRSVESNPSTSATRDAPDIETPKSGWLRETLHKILANMTIQINNLVLKYEQDDMVLSVALGTLDCYAVNDKKGWLRSFTEPQGPTQVISRAVDARDLTIFLDRYTSDRKASDQGGTIHRRVVGYELPVLSRSTISIRARMCLKPGADPNQDSSSKKAGKPSAGYAPSQACDPFFQYSIERRDVAPTTEIDVFIGELAFSLSDRQLEMLSELLQRTMQRSPRKVAMIEEDDGSSVDVAHGGIYTDVQLGNDTVGESASDAAVSPEQVPTKKSSWLSWAMETLGGPQDDEEDELISEILAETKEALRRSDEAKKRSAAAAAIALKKQASSSVGESHQRQPTSRTICCRVCINSTILTLRKHDANADEMPVDTVVDEEDISTEEQYVPVANVGLVKVSNSASVKAKLSKPASEVCSLSLTYTAMEVVTTRGEVAEPVTDLVFEVERVKMIYLHGVDPGVENSAMLAWGQVLESEQPHSSSTSSFSECVSHPYFVASFFGEEARNHGRRESRSFEIVKVSQDMEVPVWKTVERRRASTQSMTLDTGDGTCACALLAGGQRVPCVPLSRLTAVARAAVASIGVHDRKLDEAALGAAVVKSWEKHSSQEAIDFSHLTAGVGEVCQAYHTLRDPDQSAIKNLNQFLLPLLHQLLAQNCLHSCPLSNAGYSHDVRARSVHSALRLRYFVSGGLQGEQSKIETNTRAKVLTSIAPSNTANEKRSGQNIVDASLGPVILALKPSQLEDVYGLLQLVKLKSPKVPSVASTETNEPPPVEDTKPGFHAVRLITWHSLNATIAVGVETQRGRGVSAVEVTGRNLSWLASRKADEEGGAWTRKITVGGASARVTSRDDTPRGKAASRDSPLIEILTAKWTSSGSADEKAETKSEFSVSRASALIDWSHVWLSAAAVDTVLRTFGLRTYGFTEGKLPWAPQSRLQSVEICNWQLSRVAKVPREGSVDRVVRVDLASCVMYELHVKNDSMKTVLEVGSIQVPGVGAGASEKIPMLALKLQQSKSTQHSYVDLQGRASHFQLGFEGLARCANGVGEFLQRLRTRNSTKSDLSSSNSSPGVVADKKASYWNIAFNLKAEGAIIKLTPALVVYVAPLAVVSDSALHSNRRSAMEPGGSVRITATCDNIRIKNLWKTSVTPSERTSTDDVFHIEGISVSALYVQDIISSMERTSWDLTLLTKRLHLGLDRLALRHLAQVGSVGASTIRRFAHKDSSDQKVSSGQFTPVKQNKPQSIRMSYQIETLDLVFEASIASTFSGEATVVPHLRVRDIGVALRKASYRPKSDATEQHGGPFTDLQFSIADIDAWQLHKARQWQGSQKRGGRRFGTLARLSDHDFLAVLVCLDFTDIAHVAQAVNSDDAGGLEGGKDSPMAAWQSVNRLARAYRSWLDECPSFAQVLKTVDTSTLPLLATARCEVQPGAKVPPVVAVYYRDYGDVSDPAKTIIAASMENIDAIVPSSTISALASLLDLGSSVSSSQVNDQVDDALTQGEVSRSERKQDSTTTQPEPPASESVVSLVTGRIRIFLPDEAWSQLHDESNSGEARVPPPCACIVVDHVTMSSMAWCEISLDGLGYPPFNATLLPRRPMKPPQLQRLGSQPAIEKGFSRCSSRLGNISGAVVKWELTDATGLTGAWPIDVKLGRHLGFSVVGHDSEMFLHPFSVTLVDEIRSSGVQTSKAIKITKIRAEVPKQVFDDIVLAVTDIVGEATALRMSLRSWKRRKPVANPPGAAFVSAQDSTTRQMELVCDGIDAVAVHETKSLHVRLGSLGVEQSSEIGGGSSGQFFAQNLVVASRVSTGSATTTEELVLGPNSDPSAWQLNVGNTPEKLLSGRWMAPGSDALGTESSLFIDVQGFQCHASAHFIDAVLSYAHVEKRIVQRNGRRVLGDRATRQNAVTVTSLKKKVGVKVLLGPSVVSYWIRGGGAEGYADKESPVGALWARVDQLFANLEIGSGDECNIGDDFDFHQSSRTINRFISVPVMTVAANVDGLVLRTSAAYPPLVVCFKKDTLSAIPGQIQSSWGMFSKVTNQSSARTTLLQGCTVRITGSRAVVYERSSSNNVLFPTALASMHLQLDPSAMLFKVSSVSLASLLDFVAKFNASRQHKRTQNKAKPAAKRPDEDSSFSGDILVPAPDESDDDLATLRHRTERVSSPPKPGDVVFSEFMLIETASGPVPSVDLRQIDLIVDFEPSRGRHLGDEAAEDEADKDALPYDETAEVLHWIDLVNAPWNSGSTESSGDDYAPLLPENQTISWMSMKWCYHLPRRVSEIVMNPVPVPPTGVPSEWPVWEWKEATAKDDHPDQYVRLCDIVCQLRAWDSVKKCYVMVAEFLVPWEASGEDENKTHTLETKGSFGELMSLWFDEETEDHDRARFARVLEVTCSRRILTLKNAVASHKWELRWRSPLSGEQDKHRRLHVSALLAASLNIRSLLVETAFERTSIQVVLPRISAAVAYVQGQDDASHDILSAEFIETMLSLVTYAGNGGSKILWQSTLQVVFENLAQLLTIPIIPQVKVHGLIDRSPQMGTDISLALGDVHVYLPQSAILLLSSMPDILRIDAGPTRRSSSLLPVLRMQLVNLCGRDVWYRQSGTSECLELRAGASDCYSWLTLAGEPCYDSLQFAFNTSGSQAASASPSEWCDPCRIREQVATGRYFKDVGFLWVKVERSGTEISVILRAAINVLSCVPDSLWLHLQNDEGDDLPAVYLKPSEDPNDSLARATSELSGALTAKIVGDLARLGTQMTGVISDAAPIALRLSMESASRTAGNKGDLSKSETVDLRGLPVEFDPVAAIDKNEEERQIRESRRRTVVRVEDPSNGHFQPRFVVVEAIRVRQPATLPNDFADAKIASRYTWTDIFVLPSVQIRNNCDASVRVKLFGTKQDGEEFPISAHGVAYCSTLDPEKLSKIVLLDSAGSVSAVCLIANGATDGVFKSRLGSLCVVVIPPSAENPLLQIVFRRKLVIVNNSSVNLLFQMKTVEPELGTIDESIKPALVTVVSDGEVSPSEDIFPAKFKIGAALLLCVAKLASDGSSTTKYSSEVMLVLNSSSINKLVVCCPTDDAEGGKDDGSEDLLSLPLVLSTATSPDGVIKITVLPLVTVHNDTGLSLKLSPYGFQPRTGRPAIVESGDVWEVPLRHESAPIETRARSGSALASWITSALGFSSTKGKSRTTSSMGLGGASNQSASCSFRVSVCENIEDDGAYEWADEIPIRVPEILPNGILLSSSSRAYPSPSSIASRHRRVVRHSQMRHVMLSVTVSQIDSTTIHVLLFVDRQSPVALDNLWRNPIGLRAVSSQISTPDAIAGQHYMEYDWGVQQRRVPLSTIQGDEGSRSLQSWLMESSKASRGMTPEEGTVKFQIGLIEHGWSNVLWQVPGIQFARFESSQSTPAPVFLVAVTFRAGTWLISISCLDDPTSPSSRGLRAAPQLSIQSTNFDTGSISLANRFRFIVSSDFVQIHCCDEHSILSSSLERPGSETAVTYAEILRVTLRAPCISFVSTSDAPESIKTEARLGYLDYVRAYNTVFIGLENLEVEHFFETCNFPVILSVMKRAVEADPVHASIRLDLTAKHDHHVQFLSEIMNTNLSGHNERCLTLRVIQVTAWKHTIVPSYLQNVELAVAPAVIQVDDELAAHLQVFLRPISDALASRRRPSRLASDRSLPMVWKTTCRDRIRATSQLRVFIDRLAISDLEITITARMSIPVLNSLDGTPVRFSARNMRRVFALSDQLMKDLAAEYVSDILVRSPMLLMSLNIIGNPAGFFRSVGAGVRDLFEIPIAVASRDGFNPWMLTRGVFSGVASLVGHTSAAALSSLSGFSYSISRTVDHLILTPEQLRRRHYVRPTRVTSGITGGLGSLGSSVVGAATGIVSTPIAMYQEKQELGHRAGVSDVVGGFGMGLVGIVARPMGGLASLLAMTSDGILYGTGIGEQLHGTDDEDEMARRATFEARPNDEMRAKLKILRDPSVDVLVLAHGAWVDPSATLVQSTSQQLRSLSTSELGDSRVSELFSEEDHAQSAVVVSVICTKSTLFVVGMCTASSSDTDPFDYEIISKTLLSDIHAIEESLTAPSRLEIGVRTSNGSAWYHLRLVPSQRRSLSHNLRQWLQDAHGRGFPAL